MSSLQLSARRAGGTYLALGLWALSACASGPKPPPAKPPPPPAVVESVEGGGTLAISRPTPEWVRLSLWVSVGSRHATPPAVATLAARWAAQHAGAQARVLPDATEIYLDCDRAERRLKRCVASLASALAPPAPSPSQTGRMLRQLRRDRVRREASPSAALDREALAALWGEDATTGLDPLAGGSPEAITASTVEHFLRDHYGPDRALLVAAGDVREDELAGWSRGLERAREARPSQTSPSTAHATVRVIEGARTALVLALAAPSVEEASALGRAFQRQHPGSGASAFVIGAQPLLLLRVSVAGSPWGELRTAIFDALRLSVEGPGEVPQPPRPQDLASLCRRTGETWVHPSAAVHTPTPWPVGAVVALPGLTPVAPSQEEALDEARRRAQARAERALEEAQAQLSPRTRGHIGEERAEVQLPNGLRLEVERRAADETFAASVEVDGGAALDEPGRHGRAAHLATLAASACAFASRPALAEALRREGTRMRPLVSAEKWGVLAYGSAAHWRRAVDRLLRCAVRPSFRARDVEDARLALLSELHGSAAARHAWAAARTLLPQAPGALAPWGSPEGLAALGVGTLRTLHAQSMKAEGVVVRLRVAAPPAEVVPFIARRLAQLPEGRAPSPDLPARPAPRPLEGLERSDQATVRAWIGLAHAGSLAEHEAAVAVAEQVGYRLDALEGYALTGLAAGGQPFSWLWLELTVTDPARLDGLPTAVQAALRATRRSVPDAVEPALARAEQRRRSAASDPVQELRERFGAPTEQSEPIPTLRSLLQSQPTYVVTHPREP